MINEETFNEDEKNEKPKFFRIDPELAQEMNMRVNSGDDPEAFINECLISGGEGCFNPEEDFTQKDLNHINSYELD